MRENEGGSKKVVLPMVCCFTITLSLALQRAGHCQVVVRPCCVTALPPWSPSMTRRRAEHCPVVDWLCPNLLTNKILKFEIKRVKILVKKIIYCQKLNKSLNDFNFCVF